MTKRLLRMGVRHECSQCGITHWQGMPLVLHLDHINGINNDNRIENLRLLCPNCHSQTDTYGRRPDRACEGPGVLYETRRERVGTVDNAVLGAAGRKPVGVRVPPLARTNGTCS